VTDAGGVIRMF